MLGKPVVWEHCGLQVFPGEAVPSCSPGLCGQGVCSTPWEFLDYAVLQGLGVAGAAPRAGSSELVGVLCAAVIQESRQLGLGTCC